jgi:hypothetical protein
VAQRFGTDVGDPGVLATRGVDLVLALGPDTRQLQGLAEHLGQLFDGELRLEHVPAGVLAGLLALAAFAFAVALADPTAARIVDEARQLDLRDRNRDDALALPSDQFLLSEVLA